MLDPIPNLAYVVVIAIGLLSILRWFLGDVGEFVKWFRRWRNDLKS